jgi:hypothetical protein
MNKAEANREAQRKYYQKNKEAMNERVMKHYYENFEKVQKRNQDAYHNKNGKRKKYLKDYYYSKQNIAIQKRNSERRSIMMPILIELIGEDLIDKICSDYKKFKFYGRRTKTRIQLDERKRYIKKTAKTLIEILTEENRGVRQ